jgi:hypothetical protein
MNTPARREDLRFIQYLNIPNIGYCQGYFHKWIVKDNQVFAIVELSTNMKSTTGSIALVPFDRIQF